MEKFDVVVVGAGAGGLVVAIGAAKARKKVALIEKETWGGDCTNFGCIPSKSLIASAHVAHAIVAADALGIDTDSEFNADKALERVRQIVARIRHHEEPEALQAHGITTYEGAASFVDSHTLQVGEQLVRGKKIVLACGSRPLIPDVEGLDTVDYLTNETIFDLKTPPSRLAVFGGGPIGCELGQAFSRLGSAVSIIQRRPYLLAREEPEAQKILREQFEREGIELILGKSPRRVERQGEEISISFDDQMLLVDQLLVSIARTPNLEGLRLEEVGIAFTKHGIKTDSYGRTTLKHVYAVGDIAGPPFFTHLAENRARTVLTSLLTPMSYKLSPQPIPRCTFTAPEVASCGLTEEEAIEQYGERSLAIYTLPFSQVDRAITASEEEGVIKLVTKKWSSRIVGVTIVGSRAGEMLQEITLAMHHKIPLRKIAGLIHPYPTFSLGLRQTADLWLKQTVLGALKR